MALPFVTSLEILDLFVATRHLAMALQVANSDYVANRYTVRKVRRNWDRAGGMAMHATALVRCHSGVCHREAFRGVRLLEAVHVGVHLDQRFQLSTVWEVSHYYCEAEI